VTVVSAPGSRGVERGPVSGCWIQLGGLAPAVARLDAIPGIGPIAAQMILAETGADMGRFPTPAHPTSWARFAPGSASPPAARRATPAPATARQEAGHRGGRPLHPRDHLGAAPRHRGPVRRPRRGLLHHSYHPRTPRPPPHPRTTGTWLHRHARPGRLFRVSRGSWTRLRRLLLCTSPPGTSTHPVRTGRERWNGGLTRRGNVTLSGRSSPCGAGTRAGPDSAVLTTSSATIELRSGSFAAVRHRFVSQLTCENGLPRTTADLRPTPGGQGVAGSNPVSPTVEPQVRGGLAEVADPPLA
jgi:hypothetical protein